jgi:thiol peroxidase
VTLSMMRSRDFARDYGVLIEDGPLAGIAARAIFVLGADDRVLHTELVPEISRQPDYEAALAALDKATADRSGPIWS